MKLHTTGYYLFRVLGMYSIPPIHTLSGPTVKLPDRLKIFELFFHALCRSYLNLFMFLLH